MAEIVCPTHGRAGKVHVLKVMPDIPLVVAESQLPAYRDHYPDAPYLVHPDEIVGISPKRQWIVDKLGDVMMFDDDVSAIIDLQVPAKEDGRIRDPQRIQALTDRMFDMAADVGAHVVGFNTYVDPVMYRPQQPFSFRHMVSGHCLGIRPSDKLRFPDHRGLLTDDLYISALSMFHHRKTVTDQRYGAAVHNTWHETGGMATHRTWQRVIDNEKFLVDSFGDAIRRRRDGPRSTIQVEIQLTLATPW